MKIRFYLDQSKAPEIMDGTLPIKGDQLVLKVIEHFKLKEAEKHFFPYNGVYVRGLNYKKDEHGIYVETDNFIDGIPQEILDAELPIKTVTLYEEGDNGMPQFGVYKRGSSVALVDPYTLHRSTGQRSMFDDQATYVDLKGWRIRITGSSFKSVVDLFRKIQTGAIEANELWGTESHTVISLREEVASLRAQLETTSVGGFVASN